MNEGEEREGREGGRRGKEGRWRGKVGEGRGREREGKGREKGKGDGNSLNIIVKLLTEMLSSLTVPEFLYFFFFCCLWGLIQSQVM